MQSYRKCRLLLIPEVSGGLHRARCFGGLQFAQICVECA
jgi:hypothetical protein